MKQNKPIDSQPNIGEIMNRKQTQLLVAKMDCEILDGRVVELLLFQDAVVLLHHRSIVFFQAISSMLDVVIEPLYDNVQRKTGNGFSITIRKDNNSAVHSPQLIGNHQELEVLKSLVSKHPSLNETNKI